MSPILLKLLSSFLMDLDYLADKPVIFYILQWGLSQVRSPEITSVVLMWMLMDGFYMSTFFSYHSASVCVGTELFLSLDLMNEKVLAFLK